MNVEWMPLGEVLESMRAPMDLVAGVTYRRIGIYSWGKGILRRDPATVPEMGSMKYFTFPVPSLVFSNIQAWEGAVALSGVEDADHVCSSRFYPYVPKQGEDINLGFLLEFFRSEEGVALMRRASPGTQVRNKVLSRSALEASLVPLPSRHDQDRIAAHLDHLQLSIEEPASSKSGLPNPERAWLQKAFERSWPVVPLGEVFDIARGSVLKQDAAAETLALGQASVRWGFVDPSLAKPVDDDWASRQGSHRRVAVGDLLLNSTGEGTIGRAAVAEQKDADMLHDSKVMRLRPSSQGVLSQFTALFLRSPQGQLAIEGIKGANTTKQTELGIRRTSALLMPVPPPKEQQQVVDAWVRVGPLFERVAAHRRKRALLVGSIVPAARNEIFNAMR